MPQIAAITLLLLPAVARADRGEPGLQAALYTPVLEQVGDYLAGQSFQVVLDEIAAEYSCYDAVGLSGIDLDVPVDAVDLAFTRDGLEISIRFGTISGEDMVIFGEDEDWLDACVSFEKDVRYVLLEDAVLTAQLAAGVEDGRLTFEVVGEPTLSGELDMDISLWPDDITLWLFDDAILDGIAASVIGGLPPLLEDFIGGLLFAEVYGGLSVDLEPVELTHDAGAMGLAISTDFYWTAEGSCQGGAEPPAPAAAAPLDLGDPGDSALAVGITEHLLDQAFASAWAEGIFCLEPEEIGALIEELEPVLEAAGGGEVALAVSVEQAPDVAIDEGGIALTIPGLALDIEGGHDGEGVPLLHLEADIRGTLDLGVDNALSALTLSVHEVSFDIRSLEAEHWAADHPEAYEKLLQVFDAWTAGWLEERAQQIVPFASLFQVWELYIRVDALRYQQGGVAVLLSVFHESDPEVDTVPPDTAASAAVDGDRATVTWSGQDDRGEALAFEWRLDGGSWSAWTADTQVQLAGLAAGEHAVEVVARDAWLNEDPSPASAGFAIAAAPAEEAELLEQGYPRRCGCGTGPGAAIPWPALLLAAARRRRSRS